jgi:hypothetical protein
VDPDRAEAHFGNCALTVKMAGVPGVGPRKVQIR